MSAQRLLARPSKYVYNRNNFFFVQNRTFFLVEHNLFAGSGCVTVVNFVKPYCSVCVRVFVWQRIIVRVPLSACKLFAYFLAPLNADTCICLHFHYSDNVQQNKKHSTGQRFILFCFFCFFFLCTFSVYFCQFIQFTAAKMLSLPMTTHPPILTVGALPHCPHTFANVFVVYQ